MVANFWIYVVVTFIWKTAGSLKITNLYVPRGASHEAPIDCRYDLEGEPLYDVKWYKDDMQFFRCMADGTVHEFPVEGISVYYSSYAAVGSCPLKLTGLTSSSGGKYTCEVSLDAPTFRTVSESRVLRIMQFSKRVQTEIVGEQFKSSFQNQTKPSDSGVTKPTSSQHIFLAIFILLLYSF